MQIFGFAEFEIWNLKFEITESLYFALFFILPISDQAVKEFIEKEVENVSPDKRFVLYLMAATGVCVVPLSGFNTDLPGFRMTLLEPDEKKFKQTVDKIAEAIRSYVKC